MSLTAKDQYDNASYRTVSLLRSRGVGLLGDGGDAIPSVILRKI